MTTLGLHVPVLCFCAISTRYYREPIIGRSLLIIGLGLGLHKISLGLWLGASVRLGYHKISVRLELTVGVRIGYHRITVDGRVMNAPAMPLP